MTSARTTSIRLFVGGMLVCLPAFPPFIILLSAAQKTDSSGLEIHSSQEPGPAVPQSDTYIRKLLADRVDTLSPQYHGIGIVVGIIGPQGRRVISYGHLNEGDPRPLTGKTVFEIGSVTKVFTALLLADMVRTGEVALENQVAQYLPAGVKLPERDGRSITLLDLATHTSGLPFMPELTSLDDPTSPDFTSADLYRYLAGYKLKRDIGTIWDYSNLGYWLLGEALASRAGTDFENLVRTRIIEPLKLKTTDYALSPGMTADFAVGHDAALQPSPAMSAIPIYSLMPAAGGLYSTIDDLLTLLSVAIGYENSPLAAACEASVTTSRPTLQSGSLQALGWTVIGTGDDHIIFRDGGTYGYASCVAWDPAKRVGVAVLSNQATSVSDIARHLLQPSFPLEHPRLNTQVEIALDTTILGTYVGQYEAPGEGVFTIRRENDFLMIDSPAEWGLPSLRIRPSGVHDFFASEIPVRVTIQSESGGRVSGILVYPPRGQKAVPAKRLGPR